MSSAVNPKDLGYLCRELETVTNRGRLTGLA